MPCRAMGKSQQNAYIERYNRTVRHEWPPLGDCLQSPVGQRDQNIFETIEEAQEQATNWLWNTTIPLMDCGQTTVGQRTARIWALAGSHPR